MDTKFNELPNNLQKEILEHLTNNRFPEAKAIRDAWSVQHRQSSMNDSHMTDIESC